MFEAWCLIEIMGHVQLAGKVTEEVMFGAPMMRVDVPETKNMPAFTKFYGAQSIYSITPVPEEVARAMAERLGERPWSPSVVGIALPATVSAPDGEPIGTDDVDDWVDDFGYEDEDWDEDFDDWGEDFDDDR